MKNVLSQLAMVLATMVLFVLALLANETLFRWLEWAPGINFVYLPAGVRLLCTLLFAEAGAVGLLAASWMVCFLWFFPENFQRALIGGFISALAPYGAYLVARRWYGIGASLPQLNSRRLLLLSVLYALANALLHHLWFAIEGDAGIVQGFAAMFIGDLSGTLMVLYAVKLALSLAWPPQRRRA